MSCLSVCLSVRQQIEKKVNQGYARLTNDIQGHPRFSKVPQGSKALQKLTCHKGPAAVTYV